MKTCVTGGAGFIGSHLVDRLLADGHDVVVYDDLSTGNLDNLEHVRNDITFVQADVRNVDTLSEAVSGCEVVYHQAALAAVARSIDRPVEVDDVNVRGTLNVLVTSRTAGVRRVVFASSSSVYGDAPTLPKKVTMPLAPRSPYAATKVAGESYCSAFAASMGLETVALRYFNVFGPRQSPKSQYAAVVPCFIDAMSAGRPPTVHGDGGQTRDFTYVTDVVDAVIRAGRAEGASGRAFNVGCGSRQSILDLANVIAEAVGFDGELNHIETRTGDVRDSLADIEPTREVLGWEPRVSLREGIQRILAAQAAVPGSPS